MYTWRQARRKAEFSQQKVADYLGIHVNTYRALEEKPWRATVPIARKFSTFVGIPVEQLFFDNNSTESRKIGKEAG